MDRVHVARGKTFDYRYVFKDMGFVWIPEEKVWVKEVEASGNNDEDEVKRVTGRMPGVFCYIDSKARWEKQLLRSKEEKEKEQKRYRDSSSYWWNKD